MRRLRRPCRSRRLAQLADRVRRDTDRWWSSWRIASTSNSAQRYPRKRVFRLRNSSSLLRPRDADALRAELRRVAGESAMPLTFGGEVHDDTLLLTEFLGNRTGGMRG